MTREQKLREAERMLGLFLESPDSTECAPCDVPGCTPCERCCEYVTRARGLLLAALSTPADATAPAEQEVGRPPPPRPDEDGRRREWTCVCGHKNNMMGCTWCGRAPKEER